MSASDSSGWASGIRTEQLPTERSFGFEFLPIPFLAGHLQVGLTMPEFGATLAATGAGPAKVLLASRAYVMGAKVKQVTALKILVEERERAESVRLAVPIPGVTCSAP